MRTTTRATQIIRKRTVYFNPSESYVDNDSLRVHAFWSYLAIRSDLIREGRAQDIPLLIAAAQVDPRLHPSDYEELLEIV